MKDPRLHLVAYACAVAGLVLLGFAVAWFWQANVYDARLARQDAAYQADLASIAAAGAQQARQAVERQQAAEQALATLDSKYHRERTDALAENERLRGAVADGARRLRVAGTCRAGGGGVPSATGAASVGDAGTVELAPAAGRNILDIRAGIIADQAALKALQDYVNTVCR